jgi:hypothetical protein
VLVGGAHDKDKQHIEQSVEDGLLTGRWLGELT